MPTLRSLLSTLASYLALLVIPGIYYLGEWLPPLKALDAYLNARPGLVTALAVLAFVTAFAGIFLLAGAQLVVRVGDERIRRVGGGTPMDKMAARLGASASLAWKYPAALLTSPPWVS